MVRKDAREYTLCEADFPNLNIIDIEWMYCEIREWTNRPYRVQKAFMAIEMFIKVQGKNVEIHDFMLGLESRKRTLNLKPPNQ